MVVNSAQLANHIGNELGSKTISGFAAAVKTAPHFRSAATVLLRASTKCLLGWVLA